MGNDYGIYALKLERKLEDKYIRNFLKVISDEKADVALKYKFNIDRARAVLGEVVFLYGLKNRYGIDLKKPRLYKNMHGKPYLTDYPDIYFNISHSGNWVACAIGNNELGIDIEAIDYSKGEDIETVAAHFFSPREYHAIQNMKGIEKSKYFYRLWTLKESYIKFKGKGLNIPLDSFEISILEEKIILNGNDKASFKQYNLDASHILSVCGKHEGFPDDIRIIDYMQL